MATVNANGVVNPISAGTAIFTVTTADGGRTAISTVTVQAAVQTPTPTLDDYTFVVNEQGGVTITDYNGPQGINLVIPTTFNERQVTSIGEHAFYMSRLISVTIPASVTEIWYGVFSGNPITSITIGANVTVVDGFGAGFNQAYNDSGRQAGTYTGTDPDSSDWIRQ